MRSTMMDVPLTVTDIMRYGTTFYGGREVVTATEDGTRRQTYAEAGAAPPSWPTRCASWASTATSASPR